ncbi:uncharacterized protein N7515_001103 [Penicillium bovifimosum]|uniref:Uncharacterized protein n=1 Tax=Penicillium bovifimosum TaxID=126998 RepID=A0A9W9HHC4_9EURO|nr:uncharacterized protein N7515_001103 [Penicillium bovifimosum]KAJ5146539.1 hypothetical protein N7515_001103 [Penicillium bovifimosum]
MSDSLPPLSPSSSASPASPAGKPGKTMSLAANNIVQFMRRAAASKESQTPPSEPTSHTSKRPRLSTEAESPRASDMEAITAALAAEEEKRQQALARAAAEAGETHWVLDVPPAPQATKQPLVLAADSLDAEDQGCGGRRAFGNFKRKERKEVFAETGEQYTEEEQTIMNTGDPEEIEKMQKDKLRRYKQARQGPKLSDLTSISGSGRSRMVGAPSSDKKKKKRKSYDA